MKIRKIGILFHPKVEATISKAHEVELFLKRNGVQVWLCSAWEPRQIYSSINGTDLIVTIGGDGTILRAFHAIGDAVVPIVGINLGKLGFLAEIDADSAESELEKLLEGNSWIDERAMLSAELLPVKGKSQQFYALNDVSAGRGEILRLVKIEVSINNRSFTTYNADAVVIATATGSTGYALAAGGPILYPESKDLVIVPVAPHLSMPYPLILPGTSEISLTINTYHAASLSVDGHDNMLLHDGDKIIVKLSQRVARFLRIHPRENFFISLEGKLNGKQHSSGRKG